MLYNNVLPMTKIKFSHSKLDVARQCFRKYKYKYVDKVEVDEQNEASQFGGLIHEIAEFYKGGGKEELLALYHQFLPKYKVSDVYKPKIAIALKNIHTFWKDGVDGKVKESYYEDDIEILYTDEITLVGKIDYRALTNADRNVIIDYKTNKSNAYANHRNQLSMYMLLLNLKYGIEYKNMDMMVIYLAMDPIDKKGNAVLNEGWDNIKKDYKLDESDVEALKMEIDAIWTKIKKCEIRGDWPTKPSRFNCGFCKFSHLCEAKYAGEDAYDKPKL